MTLIVFEGASRSGKSTIRDKLIERNPEWVMWKGENLMRKGVGDSWIDYRERYHEALHRLYELNPENIIVADRGFTDCAYNSNIETREEFRRLAACYGDAKILYFYPGYLDDVDGTVKPVHKEDGKRVLRERGTRDSPKLSTVLNEYEKLLSMFDYTHINTDTLDETASVDMAEDKILQWHNSEQHDPDV